MMQDDPRSLKNRMIRAAKLDIDLYEEVEADTTATGQALQAVVVASLAAGIGVALQTGIFGLLFGVIAAVMQWVVWSAITYWVGKTFFKTAETSVTYGEMLRTIGFAYSPQVLLLFAFIPILGVLIVLGVFVWILLAGVIAVRQAMDFSTGRAVGTCVVGLVIASFVNYLFLGFA